MKPFRLILFILVGTVLLSACATTPQDAASEPLRVGYVLWPGYYPMLIAEERGIFEEYGVSVETIAYPTIGEEYAAYSSGNLDGMALVIGDILPQVKRDNSRVVLVTDFSNGSDQIVATADITTPADLRGKRIGVRFGSFGELMVRHMLEENNIRIDEVTLVNVFPELLQESIGTQVDAGHTYEPFTGQSLDQGAHIIYDSADVPGLVTDVIAFQTHVVEQRSADVQAFVSAWFEALAWWQANPEEGNALLSKLIGVPADEIAASLAGVNPLNLEDNQKAFTQGTDNLSLHFTTQEYIDFLGTSGVLSVAPDLDVLLTASFLK